MTIETPDPAPTFPTSGELLNLLDTSVSVDTQLGIPEMALISAGVLGLLPCSLPSTSVFLLKIKFVQ